MKRHDIGYRTREFFTPRVRKAKGDRNAPRRAAQYRLASIPVDLWKAFRARCETFPHPDGAVGVSVRARLLTLIKHDIEAASSDLKGTSE